MNMAMQILGLLLLSCCLSWGHDMIQIDKRDWVDPTDMLNYDITSKSMRKSNEIAVAEQVEELRHVPNVEVDGLPSQESKEENKVRNGSDDDIKRMAQSLDDCERKLLKSVGQKQELSEMPYMKRYITRLLKFLSVEPQEENMEQLFSVRMMLTAKDWQLLSQFSDSTKLNIQDVDEILSRLIISSVPISSDEPNLFGDDIFLALLTTGATQNLILILSVVAFTAICLVFPRLAPFFLGMLVFVISVFWHWQHMYKVVVAKRHAELSKYKDLPIECKPDEMNLREALQFWFNSKVIGSEDKCEKYHKALLVDPFWDVSPAMAVSETITKFMVHPMEFVGTNIGKFVSGMHQNLSFGLFWVVMPAIFLLIILILIMCCGYRIKMPFNIFSIEPGTVPQPPTKECLKQLKQEVLSIQQMVNTMKTKECLSSMNGSGDSAHTMIREQQTSTKQTGKIARYSATNITCDHMLSSTKSTSTQTCKNLAGVEPLEVTNLSHSDSDSVVVLNSNRTRLTRRTKRPFANEPCTHSARSRPSLRQYKYACKSPSMDNGRVLSDSDST